MKKILLLFFIQLFALAPCLHAQNFWQQLPFPDTLVIYCITVNNQGHIFVGAVTAEPSVSKGVYRSTDDGQTWQHVLNTGIFAILSLNQSANEVIYAGSNGSPDGQNYLYKTIDNGNTWNPISLPGAGNVVEILCVGQDTLYVSRWEDNGALLLRSVDAGISWQTVFTTSNHTSEYISDIAISSDGEVYIGLMCYFENMGGVYRSADGISNWEFVGLYNHQVMTVDLNSNDELFIGVWGNMINGSGGLYNLDKGASAILPLLFGPSISAVIINDNDDIYFAVIPGGIIRSLDGGQTFAYINEGLSGAYGIMTIDNQGFIYSAGIYNGNKLVRSVNSTITNVSQKPEANINKYEFFPNPAKNKLNVKCLHSSTFRNIRIYDLLGNLLLQYENTFNNNQITLDVSSLKPGLYSIIIFDGITVEVSKLIIN